MNLVVSRHAARGWEKGLCAMSLTPVGGHPQGWEHKLADRSSLPPASGEEKSKSQSKHVFTQPQLPKGPMQWREETEGSSASSARSPASPPYLRWARTLHDLLEDAEGVRLFRKFVGGAGKLHVDRLNFFFAVQGLRQETDPHVIRQLVSAIYKFLRKSQLAMSEELKLHVKQSLKDGSSIEKTIFDNMEQEVTRAITESTYQAFLRSEAYVSYVSAATQPLSSPDASPPAPSKEVPGPAACLATLHEGQELGPVAGGPAAGAAPARLTHDALLATQSRRLHSDQAPGSFARKRSVYSHAPHMSYAGYCPASRQDSERASLSSGRTDSDVLSLSGSSVDGLSMRLREPREPRHRPRLHGMDRHAVINKEQDTAMVSFLRSDGLSMRLREPREPRNRPRLHGMDRHAVINKEQDTAMVIPRTQRMQSEQLRVLEPSEFAPLLISKLEKVQRERENKERLERRLAEGDGEDMSSQTLPPQLVAAAIRVKLQVDDDNDQDILDQHVSRVWSERTPGASPPGGRRARPRRRAPSTLSADSGLYDTHSGFYDAHSDRASASRRFSKKTSTELTDSGVSVVSSHTAARAGAAPRLLQWVTEGSERLARQRSEQLSSRASSAERANKPRTKASGSKSSGSGASATSDAPCTVVVVSFLDELVPYRIKVPAAPLTLRTFKEYLPRKGNYRYFFKTECADLDNTVLQEEVSHDAEVLPMFEGKVMARVKSIE